MKFIAILYVIHNVLLVSRNVNAATLAELFRLEDSRVQEDISKPVNGGNLSINDSSIGSSVDSPRSTNDEGPSSQEPNSGIASEDKEIKNIFSSIVPKIGSLMLLGGPQMNAFKALSFLPYYLLATVKPDPSTFVKDRNIDANDKQPESTSQNSETSKKLSSADKLPQDELNFMSAYQDFLTSPVVQNLRDETMALMKTLAENNPENAQDKNNPVKDEVRGILSNPVAGSSGVDGEEAYEKLQALNSDGNGSTSNWKQSFYPGAWTNSIMGMTSTVSKTIGKGGALATHYGTQYVVPKLASYILPAGMSAGGVKLICLATYAMILAQQEFMTPEVAKGGVVTPENSSRAIINKFFNNEKIMEMFPYKDYPNLGFKLIQFLAGPETAIIDVFFRELKKMNDGRSKGTATQWNSEKIIRTMMNNRELMTKVAPFLSQSKTAANMLQYITGPKSALVDKYITGLQFINSGTTVTEALNKLGVSGVLKNTKLGKKLFTTNGVMDEEIKSYLEMGIGQIQAMVIDEVNKNIGENEDQKNSVQSLLTPKPVEYAENEEGEKNGSDNLTAKVQSESDDENTGSTLASRAVNMDPTKKGVIQSSIENVGNFIAKHGKRCSTCL